MSTDELLETVRDALTPPYSAVLLFGSYARRDQTQMSDIDILKVTPTPSKSYSLGKINVTCYTRDQLLKMAETGSLFTRHLVYESIPLIDPDNFLDRLRARFRLTDNYDNVLREVKCSVGLLAITENTFTESAHYYSATASYLLRTYVYAFAFRSGSQTFSMSALAEAGLDHGANVPLAALRAIETYANFRYVVDMIFHLVGIDFTIREETLEAYIVNCYGTCDLAVVLGLRILAHGELIGYAHLRGKV